MRFITSLVLLLSALSSVHSLKDNLITAIKQISEHLYIKNCSTINILKPANLSYIEDDFAGKLIQDFVVRINDYNNIERLGNRKRKFNIVLLDSIESFRALDICPEAFDFNGFYLFVLSNEFDEVEEIFSRLWAKYIYNVIVMFEALGSVRVMTFKPFDGSCANTTPVLINSFDNGTFSHPIETIFLEKFNDLFNCPIKVTTFKNNFCIMAEENSNGVIEYSGIDIDILSELSKDLNFSPQINLLRLNATPWGMIYQNGSVDGAMGEIAKGRTDVAIGCYYLRLKRFEFADSSVVYYTTPDVFAISPGEKFSAFEKLLQPFDHFVWIILLITIFGAFVVIAVVRRQSEHVQDFVFGRFNRHPGTNLWVAVFGGSQGNLPEHNFSRFLLMMFLIFCLVMRSAYQGALFKFLQTDQHHNEVDTIDDLVRQKYDIYIHESHADLFEGQPLLIERIKYNIFPDGSLENLTHVAHIFAQLDVIYYNKMNKGQSPKRICREHIWNAKFVFYFPKNHFLIEAVNKKLGIYLSSGIMNHLIDRYIDLRYWIMKPEKKGPQRLSLLHLEGAFKLWKIMLSISFICFLMEILVNYFKRRFG